MDVSISVIMYISPVIERALDRVPTGCYGSDRK